MKKNDFFSIIFLLCIVVYTTNCSGQAATHSNNNGQLINCYILKPIQHNEEYRWVEHLPQLDTNISNFLENVSIERDIKRDTSIGYITNFECQKKILINDDCFSKLNSIDSIDLNNIYFYSRFNTSRRTGSNIEFVRSYEKKILNLGNSLIYEYHLRNTSRIEPDFFHIIIFKKENYEIGEDHEGIVICSDGLDWSEVKEKGIVIPIHLTNLRGGMQIKVPLFFNKYEFIPIGHFKGQW